jgi:hypothetical protein
MRKVLLVLLILVIGGVIAADRIGVRIAEDQIAKQVAAQYDLPQRPEVEIHGFPFLTQAIGGEYQQVDVAIGDWTQAGVTVRDVTVQMRQIGAPLSDITSGNVNNVTVQTATATAVIPYEVLQQRAPDQVERIEPKGDDLQVGLSGQLGGVPLSGTAVVSVKATSKGIAVTPISASPRGTGIPIPLSLIKGRLTWNVPLTNLPVGSRISEIQPTADGLRVTATASDLKMGNLSNAA